MRIHGLHLLVVFGLFVAFASPALAESTAVTTFFMFADWEADAGWVGTDVDAYFYLTAIYNTSLQSNGSTLPNGSVVSAGSMVRILWPLGTTDISWVGTGWDADSPYGVWSSSAISCANGQCTQIGYTDESYASGPLLAGVAVVPQTPTVTGNGMSCGAVQQTSSAYYADCTITAGSGNIVTVTMIHPSTNALFRVYHPAVTVFNDNESGSSSHTYIEWSYVLSSVLPSASQTFTLFAYNPNNAPTAPVISGPTSGSVSSALTFGAVSTDPDNDTLRYGFDWNGDNIVDQWMPSANYVSSGAAQQASYSWTSSGVRTFKVLAQDSKGTNSAFSSYSITIIPAPTISSFTINGSSSTTVTRGDTETFAWSATDATSCTASSSDQWSGTKATSGTSSQTAQTTSNFNLTCTGDGGTTTKTVHANVVCTPATGDWEACDCDTMTKTRSNLSAACLTWTESESCSNPERNSCRDFNWKEVAP